jgi:hypothetical protein
MGGAYGHMNHPFDLDAVRTGEDLVKFFYDIITSIESSPAALKLDGVNASIKVVNGDIDGRQFAGDRGSSYEVDVSGITKARVAERWVDNPTHGMIGSYRKVLDIFNASLPGIKHELRQLGMWDNPSRYFNIEFVEVDEEDKRTNVVEYDRSYIAIHGLAQFYEKRVVPRPDKQERSGFSTASRPGLPRPEMVDDNGDQVLDRRGNPKLIPDKGIAIPYNKEVLETLVRKMRPIAAKLGFDIYSSIPTKYKTDTQTPDVHKEFERVLNTPLVLCIDETDCPVDFKLKDWLKSAHNPKGIKGIKIKTKAAAVDPLNKDIYLYGKAQKKLSDLLVDPEQTVHYPGVGEVPAVRTFVDGIVFWEAIKNLGHVVKSSLTSETFGDVESQEGIVVRDKRFGSTTVQDPNSGESFDMPLDVKITGEFITQGLDTPFGKVTEATEPVLAEGLLDSLVDEIRAGMGYLPDWAQTAAMIFDPTGLSQWPAVEDAYDDFSADDSTANATALAVSIVFAIPIVGGRLKGAKAGAMGVKRVAGSAKLAKMAKKIPGLVPALAKANKLILPAGLYSLAKGISSALPTGDPIAQALAKNAAAPGGVRAAASEADQEAKERELDSAEEAGKTIALFPGSFKPPHRGHVAALMQLAMDPAISLVRILVSNPQGKGSIREITPGVVLGAEAAATIWRKIISNLDLPEGKVEVEVSDENSPFLSALKYVEEPPPSEGGFGAPVGATIVFGCGDKADAAGISDVKRFDAVDSISSSGRVRPDLKLAKRACKLDDTHSGKYMSLLDRESNRRIRDGVPNKTSENDPSEDFHASDFRYFLKLYMNPAIGPHSKRVVRELLKDFVPEPKEDNINSIVDTLSDVNSSMPEEEEIVATESKKKLNMHYLFSLVEEVISEISGMGGGSVAGYAGPVYKRDKKKKKKKEEANIYKLENIEDTITNILETEY